MSDRANVSDGGNEETSSRVNILIAEDNPHSALPLKKIVQIKLEHMIDGVEFHIDIVTTLSELIRLSPQADATIVDLTLADAGPEEVIQAMPGLRRPFIVMTGDDRIELKTRCQFAGAVAVFTKTQVSIVELCFTILNCLSKGVIQSAGVSI